MRHRHDLEGNTCQGHGALSTRSACASACCRAKRASGRHFFDRESGARVKHRTLTIYEDEASGTIATNGSGIGAVDGWNGFLEYDNAALTGSPVGQNDGTCVRTAASGYNYECTWTFRLTGGGITVSGSLNDHDLFNLAVVGGTGKFAGVSGTMHASFDGTSNVYTNTLHFMTL